jgi:GrpB-like predicted nucleotidyltransferase (UPF0157 family)
VAGDVPGRGGGADRGSRPVLAFRDYLRAHPSAATDYARLKQDLAIRHPTDRDAYTDGKSHMVAAFSAAGRQGALPKLSRW